MTIDELNSLCLTLTGKSLNQRGAVSAIAALVGVEPITVTRWKQRGEVPESPATKLLRLKAGLQDLIN